MTFKRADKMDTQMKIALVGPSGSGKSYSSLRIATGLSKAMGGEKIAMIDTENGSGSIYHKYFEYDIDYINAPYRPSKYVEMIDNARESNYKILIIDSMTHEWDGEGGILDMHTSLSSNNPKKTFTSWGQINPHHNSLMRRIIEYPGFVICTMRSKEKYKIEYDPEDRKSKPVSIGERPIQREGVEYEFTLAFFLSRDNSAECIKDRTMMFNNHSGILQEEHGKMCYNWTKETSKPAKAEAKERDESSINSVINICKQAGIDEKEIEEIINKKISEINESDIDKIRVAYVSKVKSKETK